MTVKDKIRAEVERLKMEYDKENIFRTVRGDTAREVFGKLLYFIDSLPEEPASEDLEEAADKYAKEQYPWQNGYEKWELPIRDFIAGAEFQKQQMMKDAIDATILDIDAQTIEFGLWPEKLSDIKEGDRVKLIIVKDN